MSLYTFTHVSEFADEPTVSVQFNDADAPCIENVIQAFEQFLLGVTFQPGSIEKFINVEAVRRAIMEAALMLRDYQEKHGK